MAGFYLFLFFFIKDSLGLKYLGCSLVIFSLILFNLIIYLFNRNYDKLKQRLVNQTFLLVTLLILIIISEIFLHVAMPAFLDLPNGVSGELNDFVVRGNFDASVAHKKVGAFRILGISDSFADQLRLQGFNYHDFLLRKLQALPGGERFEIINAGMPRTGPGYYWNTLKQHGDLINPDLVLVGFFLGNDFKEMKFDNKFIGQFISVPRHDDWRRYFKLNNYWCYQYLVNKEKILEDNFRRDYEFAKGLVREKGTFSRKGFYKIEQGKLWFFEKRLQAQLRDLFQPDAGVLLQMKQWCDDRNIELVIAILPTEIQVDNGMRAEVLDALKVKEDSLDFDYPNALLKNYLEKHRIHYVDLTGPMRQAAQTKRLYVLRDTHWNIEGNKLAAEIIFTCLQEHKLLPAVVAGK